MKLVLRTLVFVGILFAAMPVFAAGEITVQESMQKREWAYGETPVFTTIVSLTDASSSDTVLEGRVVRDDGIEISSFSDRARISSNEPTERHYGLSIPEWKAGYYYVVLKVASPQTDQTIIRRVTFSLRPNIAPRVVYGGAAIAIIIGLSTVVYVILRRREFRKERV